MPSLRYTHYYFLILSVLVHLARSFPQTVSSLNRRQNISCENTATSRNCWGEYSIDTDYYTLTPDTGVIREYWLSAENTTLAPDGYERQVLVFNSSLPGPTITADWGDDVIVHVTNNMEDGTAIHFHGIRQLNTNPSDGVPGVSQCPIPPGATMTYKFRATQYGTSWYHSHFSLQLGDGLFGPVVINGPATANYDEDLGPFNIQDWGHESAFTVWEQSQRVLAIEQPELANGLIRGMNTFDCTGQPDPPCLGTGQRTETTFESGEKYLMRIIGSQIDGYMKFTIDGHGFTVIASDFVPIEPYYTNNIILSSGQRYDIIVEANQAVDNYWMRAIYQTACNQNNNQNKDNILGIVRYSGANATADPTTSVWSNITNSCGDEDYSNLTPWLKLNVGSSDSETWLPVQWYYELDLVYHWTLHSKTLIVNWSQPTLETIFTNPSVTTFPDDSNVIEVNGTDQWTYWIIQDESAVNAYHPMHLHGHDFYILAQGSGIFDPDLATLNTVNPSRRDTATMQGTGYLVIAFLSDNPGAWLLHCHIAWHASQGLALQYMEQQSDIPALVSNYSSSDMASQCSAWQSWYATTDYLQDDSGI